MADLFVGGKNGTGQKKVLPTTFLQTQPPRPTNRFVLCSGVATWKKGAFWRFCVDFLRPCVCFVFTKGVAHTA
jgi:hypothetical protein